MGHPRIEGVRPILVDQGHRPLGQPFARQEGLVRRRDDVEQGVADGGDVVLGGHEGSGAG